MGFAKAGVKSILASINHYIIIIILFDSFN